MTAIVALRGVFEALTRLATWTWREVLRVSAVVNAYKFVCYSVSVSSITATSRGACKLLAK